MAPGKVIAKAKKSQVVQFSPAKSTNSSTYAPSSLSATTSTSLSSFTVGEDNLLENDSASSSSAAISGDHSTTRLGKERESETTPSVNDMESPKPRGV